MPSEFMPLNPEDPEFHSRFYQRVQKIVPDQKEREMLWNDFRVEVLHRVCDQNDQLPRNHPEKLSITEIAERLLDQWETGTWPPRS